MSFQERKEKEPQADDQAEGERGRNYGHEGSRDDERLESIAGVPGRISERVPNQGTDGLFADMDASVPYQLQQAWSGPPPCVLI